MNSSISDYSPGSTRDSSSGTQSSHHTHSNQSGYGRKKKCSPQCPHGCGCSRSRSTESTQTDGSSSQYHLFELRPNQNNPGPAGPLRNSPSGNGNQPPSPQGNNQPPNNMGPEDDDLIPGNNPFNLHGTGKAFILAFVVILIIIILAVMMYSQGRKRKR